MSFLTLSYSLCPLEVVIIGPHVFPGWSITKPQNNHFAFRISRQGRHAISISCVGFTDDQTYEMAIVDGNSGDLFYDHDLGYSDVQKFGSFDEVVAEISRLTTHFDNNLIANNTIIN